MRGRARQQLRQLQPRELLPQRAIRRRVRRPQRDVAEGAASARAAGGPPAASRPFDTLGHGVV